MKKFFDFLENKLAPFGEKVGNQRHLKAIREGVMMAMPLVLIGSLFVLILSFPSVHWVEWLKKTELDVLLRRIQNNTFGLIALLSCFGIAYRLSISYKTDGVTAGALSLASFLLMMPSIVDEKKALGIPYGQIGGRGLFSAIFIAIITAEIYRWFIQKNIVIKMPKNVPDVVGKSFSALIPGIVNIIFFSFLIKILEILKLGNLNDVLGIIIGKPLGLIAGTLIGTFIAVLLNSIFWFCGVNGGQVIGSVMNPLWLQYADENRIAMLAGTELKNIITGPFIDLFVFIGGGGATIGLTLCLLFFSKSNSYKTLGKISGIPALFNINTAILFSFPTVLNPIMLIPFILTPLINSIVTYFAMYTKLVPLTTGVTLPWTTPPIIGGFLATGNSWQGALLQVILVLISFTIYYPFFKAADIKNLKLESETK